MQASDLSALSAQVLWAAFILSALFGAIAQRTHFCTMGAVSDVVNMGDWTRMRQWGMAIGVAMIGFAVLAATGQIDPSKTLYASNRIAWLSAAVGGAMFGFGMVLASGCGSKTLVRIGGGSLKSVVVFVVMGVAGFATLKGMTAVLRVNTVDRVWLRSVVQCVAFGSAVRCFWHDHGFCRAYAGRCCWVLRWWSGRWPAAISAVLTTCWQAWALAPWWWHVVGQRPSGLCGGTPRHPGSRVPAPPAPAGQRP
jgi:uncharacterized membrane protein YedE/YeeE